jgi:hypothetical protein
VRQGKEHSRKSGTEEHKRKSDRAGHSRKSNLVESHTHGKPDRAGHSRKSYTWKARQGTTQEKVIHVENQTGQDTVESHTRGKPDRAGGQNRMSVNDTIETKPWQRTNQ